MKFQSAPATDRERTIPTGLHLSKEAAVLAAAVGLAFAFVTACIFLLG
ncbi:MAG: hypothetical protein KL863_11120 [Rhizobium sp.]|nr:hypothetical protein [Rhizobium sp.]